MKDLEAIRARDAEVKKGDPWLVPSPPKPISMAVIDRRALLAAYDELLAERALIVQRAENAEAALVESDALLREMLAWKVAIEYIAPELGGAIMTLARIDAFLAPDSADDDLTPCLCGY
jgi:hypothetical protein